MIKERAPPPEIKMGDATNWKKVKLPVESVIMIKPEVDASNKEIFLKNNFRTDADNLLLFVEGRGKDQSGTELYRPRFLGDYSGVQQGTYIHMSGDGAASKEPDYNLNYLLGNKKKQRALLPKVAEEAADDIANY